MIFYVGYAKKWEDTEDSTFGVPMVLEKCPNLNECTFETQSDFWEWYHEYSNYEGKE